MYLAQVRGVMKPEQARASMLELTRIPSKLETVIASDPLATKLPSAIRKCTTFSFSDAAFTSDRARRRAQAKRNFLHTRRGLPRRRNEAWS